MADNNEEMQKQAAQEFARRFELVKTACAVRIKQSYPQSPDEECLKVAHELVVGQIRAEQAQQPAQ